MLVFYKFSPFRVCFYLSWKNIKFSITKYRLIAKRKGVEYYSSPLLFWLGLLHIQNTVSNVLGQNFLPNGELFEPLVKPQNACRIALTAFKEHGDFRLDMPVTYSACFHANSFDDFFLLPCHSLFSSRNIHFALQFSHRCLGVTNKELFLLYHIFLSYTTTVAIWHIILHHIVIHTIIIIHEKSFFCKLILDSS